MTRTTYPVRQHAGTLDGQRMFAAITLPAIPGVVIASDRAETDPALPVIRIRKRPHVLRGVAKLQHDDRMELQIIAKIREYTQNGELQL